MTNVLIVGGGQGGTSILDAFQGIKTVKVLGICDVNNNAPGMMLARKLGVSTFTNLNDIFNMPADIIIEATGNAKVQEIIYANKSEQMNVIDSHGANLMMTLVEAREDMIHNLHIEAQ